MEQNHFKKNLPLITLGFLVIVLVYLVSVNKNKLFKPSLISTAQTSSTTPSSDLPVSINSQNVGGVLIHYYFTGKLKEFKKTALGTQIVYENADTSLPALVVGANTRVERITPPYAQNAVNISVDTLKVGQTIDVSAEYDLRVGTWNVLDVFMATDRN